MQLNIDITFNLTYNYNMTDSLMVRALSRKREDTCSIQVR